jgi:2-C-methyl-D-erythritol 4-phosphate cytidylyltransferase/2-C-methyl-D-erythritol 2,4-cyclodiphosphate synthase
LNQSFKTIALILASGNGNRFQSNIPKQFHKIGDSSILRKTIEQFTIHNEIDAVAVVINNKFTDLYEQETKNLDLLPFIIGGEERQDSSRLGLEAIAKYNPKNVLIHDGARPFISSEIISNTIKNLEFYDCVIPGIAVSDTIKKFINNEITSLTREDLYFVQTPQGAKFNVIYNLIKNSKEKYTDESQLFEQAKMNVHIIEGSKKNIKITTKEDLIIAEQFIRENKWK